jgi:Holliday junction resolvase
MSHYGKGAAAERELIHRLFDVGFAVVRVAGSGKSSLPAPDILALSPGQKFCIEVKAVIAPNLFIPKYQMLELADWGRRGGIIPLIAWKVPRDWFYLTPEDFHETGKNFGISRHEAKAHSTPFEVLVGRQTQLTKANKNA